VLQERWPQYEFEVGPEVPCPENVDTSRLPTELGLHLRPTQETVLDMAASLMQLGVAMPRCRTTVAG